MPEALKPGERWSLDFLSDTFDTSRRFRILAVNDDCCRENLCLVADTSWTAPVLTIAVCLPSIAKVSVGPRLERIETKLLDITVLEAQYRPPPRYNRPRINGNQRLNPKRDFRRVAKPQKNPSKKDGDGGDPPPTPGSKPGGPTF